MPDGATAVTVDRKDTSAFEAAIKAAYKDTGVLWDLVVDRIGYEAEDAQRDIEVFRLLSRQFVFVSTDFVYEPEYRQFPQSEDNSHFLTDDSYGAKKRQCEREFINNSQKRQHK